MESNNCLSVQEIARQLGVEFRGDGDHLVCRVAPLDSAGPDSISFLSNHAYRRYLATTRAGAVLLTVELARECPPSAAAVVVADPYLAYARVAMLLHPPPRPTPGIHPSAIVAAGAALAADAMVGAHAVLEQGVRVGSGSVIGAGCYLGPDARIGDNCLLHPNVTVYRECRLGARVVVHAGAVIGADGFGFAYDEGRWLKIPQLGVVLIGDDCEIGAGTTIDRGALGDTVLEDGVILDNQIQVAHNVRIGAGTAIAGCVGIAGSAEIGRRCRIGGGAGILGHLRIADDVQIAAMSLVTKSIDNPGSYASGTPLEPSERWRKNHARFRQLDTLARRLARLEQRVNLDEPER